MPRRPRLRLDGCGSDPDDSPMRSRRWLGMAAAWAVGTAIACSSPAPVFRPLPPPDSDGDGVFDQDDRCPNLPAGSDPDPERTGCPFVARDGVAVSDRDDACPGASAGA